MSDLIDSIPEDKTLSFSEDKQSAILGHILHDNKFFLMCKDAVKPSFFKDIWISKVYEYKLIFFTKYNRPATIDELKNCKEILTEEQKNREYLYKCISYASINREKFKLDALSEELTDWIHSAILEIGLKQSAFLYNSKKSKEALQFISDSVEKIKKVTFQPTMEERFDNYTEDMDKQKRLYNDALTTGLELFDTLINPKTTKGSLLPGDMSLVLASTGTGKTTCMATVLAANIQNDKNVLYITLEDQPENIKNKIWCNLLGITEAQLLGYRDDKGTYFKGFYQTLEGQGLMNDYITKYLNAHLTYIPINKAGLTVEEVEGVVRKFQERRMALIGFGYDMLVVDYPAKLITTVSNKLQKRENDAIVYTRFEQLGLEYRFHTLVAIQSNREGSKLNSRKDHNTQLLRKESASESFAPAMVSTNIWTVNRDDDAKHNDYVIYFLDKARHGGTEGSAIICRSDFERCKAHGNDLGATYYMGNNSYAEKTNAILEHFKGGAVNKHELQGFLNYDLKKTE